MLGGLAFADPFSPRGCGIGVRFDISPRRGDVGSGVSPCLPADRAEGRQVSPGNRKLATGNCFPGGWQLETGRNLLLRVHVQPRARRDEVVGWRADGSLKVKVSAPPEQGRANEALIAILAGHFGVPRHRITIIRGKASRDKTVQIRGLTGDLSKWQPSHQ